MCCGKKRKRKKIRQASQVRRASKPGGKATVALPAHKKGSATVYFQYLGSKRLTVMGPKTRKPYRFDGLGATVAVDPKDKHALRRVKLLRQVRNVT